MTTFATEEQVQIGARAMCKLNSIRRIQQVEFDKMDIREREHWQDLARVCLTSALSSPHLWSEK